MPHKSDRFYYYDYSSDLTLINLRKGREDKILLHSEGVALYEWVSGANAFGEWAAGLRGPVGFGREDAHRWRTRYSRRCCGSLSKQEGLSAGLFTYKYLTV